MTTVSLYIHIDDAGLFLCLASDFVLFVLFSCIVNLLSHLILLLAEMAERMKNGT